MYIVTGGAGFIGSNIVKTLNEKGITDIVVVDDLTDGRKFKNIVDCKITDYIDKDEFMKKILETQNTQKNVKAIFHLGACSSTTEWDGKFMMENNYEYSKQLLHFSMRNKIQFIYASSAAVYGNNEIFNEIEKNELPVNVYGYSKILFDEYVRQFLKNNLSQIVGLRYFNVYGPRESHKNEMASVAFHFNKKLLETGVVNLFEGRDEYKNGEQKRDFVYVGDVANVNLWFLDHNEYSGIYNVGTGEARTFNDMARAVIKWHGKGEIKYIPFPEKLIGHYQNYTKADISNLRKINCNINFMKIEDGVALYLAWLNKK